MKGGSMNYLNFPPPQKKSDKYKQRQSVHSKLQLNHCC